MDWLLLNAYKLGRMYGKGTLILAVTTRDSISVDLENIEGTHLAQIKDVIHNTVWQLK